MFLACKGFAPRRLSARSHPNKEILLAVAAGGEEQFLASADTVGLRSEAAQKRNQRCLVCRTEFRQKLQAGNRALGDARRTPGLSFILGTEARRIEQLFESEDRRVVQ